MADREAKIGVDAPNRDSWNEVLRVALRLGLTSFGGPIAHIGYFRREYLERRHWLDDSSFADLVALTQLLPGPASSQLGIAIGAQRAGIAGGIDAWLGFTLPSAIAMLAFGLLAASLDLSGAGWVHGLKLAAVAVVAQAVYLMARTLTPDWPRRAMALAAAAVALTSSIELVQVAIIVAGGLLGRLVLAAPPGSTVPPNPSPISRRLGAVSLAAFGGLLVLLPIVRGLDGFALELFDAFYRAGSLVFGGGHVVLPLLHSSVVTPGWLSNDQFLAGYGAAQALPGPLFTVAAYLGAVTTMPPNGMVGGVVAIIAIFLPSFLLVFGALPYWEPLRRSGNVRRAVLGTNAAVVGLLLAALYTPIWTSAIRGPIDVTIAVGALSLLSTGRVPPILVVVLCAIAGQGVGAG